MSVATTQTAAVVCQSGAHDASNVRISSTHPVPVPAEGEVLIKLEYSGVCHSDLHSIRGDTPMTTDVAGHEGIGKVVQGGQLLSLTTEMSTRSYSSSRGWLWSSCLECEICAINHTACPHQRNAGANVPGTFQQYVVSPAAHVTKIPTGLDPAMTAPLLCAGIAMYSSIKKTKARSGDWLAIIGAGGGLGHMGIQIASAQGIKVLAIDSGEKKKDLCLSLGATEFLDYKAVDVVSAAKSCTSGYGVHAVVCTANGEKAYEQSMHMLRPLGTLVCVGIPNLPFRLPATPFDMIVRGKHPVELTHLIGLTIVGNSAGTAQEMNELLEMAVADKVKAHVEVYDLQAIGDVLHKLESAEIEGRAVLQIP
ncbi:hypothetical protein N7468_005658 [Penicillium chermesinum]|uniref:Enoyl reductase (ER) domain-containing protein n=1 Tax=Penicillium chermesinum TaxID=63820 RepID=A0A9W9TNE7_9EURO|nr:uncharacterized protein N7468_005658 [Penicillium chermesinum]KAJ5232702.1 hypothetical protein N7468_005658 [Penicillium chermesinum]KAJ6172360.1 hypothetical protein N7470_001427 [Penicillium chermesinum]